MIQKAAFFRAINISVYSCTTQTILAIILLPLFIQNVTITPAMVFLPLTWINVLKLSLALFMPNAVAFFSESRVSIKRIQNFLELGELEVGDEVVIKDEKEVKGKEEEEQPKLKIDNLICHWDDTAIKDTLFMIELDAVGPQCVAVVGPVGCGKSSLIQAILGEIPVTTGKVEAVGKLSYTPQSPWVFSATIQDNILFGEDMDEERYQRVIQVCDLNRDLESFENGDETYVGDRGVSLSGGQKARVSLARAVYRKADIYLLDDPLSAVDAQVGKLIFEQCISGFLNDKIVLLATHQLHFLKNVKEIIVLDNGRIEERGTYDELMDEDDGLFVSLMKQEKEDTDMMEDASETAFSGDHVVQPGDVMTSKYKIRTPEKSVDEDMKSTSDQDKKEVDKNDDDEEEGVTDRLLENGRTNGVVVKVEDGKRAQQARDRMEISDSGKVKASTYWRYARSGANPCRLIFAGLLMLMVHGLIVFTNIWLSEWTKDEELQEFNSANATVTEKDDFFEKNQLYFGLFSGAVALLIISSLVSIFQFFKLAMNSSKALHYQMFFKVLRTKSRFFDVNPTGRIMNRFSKDLGNMDDLLPSGMIDVIWVSDGSMRILDT